MNYRHAFHAGNAGDVLKHVVLVAILDRLLEKPAPLLYLDTHAGRGSYDLRSSEATRGGEWALGIGRLLDGRGLPAEVVRYRSLVREFGETATAQGLRFYPGSPLLALRVLRREDRKVFVEKHPDEAAKLREATRGRRNLSVIDGDGYAALKAQLPPRENRGIVLIDPPFESPGEFADLASALVAAHERWPNGLLCAWYPLKPGAGAAALHARLVDAGVRRTLVLELLVRPPDSPTGMTGSGLVLVNPPWRLDERMREVLPALHARLAPDGAGGVRIEWLTGE